MVCKNYEKAREYLNKIDLNKVRPESLKENV